MKFQKNKNGNWETEYDGEQYQLIDNQWKVMLKFEKDYWFGTPKKYKKTIIATISGEIDFKSPAQIILTREFRKQKLKQIESS